MESAACSVWLGFVLAVVTTVVLGLEMAFNVYAVALKKTFNFTQTEVGLRRQRLDFYEFSASEYDYYKLFTVNGQHQCTGFEATLLHTDCPYNKKQRNGSPYGMKTFMDNEMSDYDFSFISATDAGQNAGTLRLLSISVQNFSKQHTGKIVGVALAAAGSAKFVYGGLFELFTADNIGNFFLAVTIGQFAFIVICSILHRPRDAQDKEELEQSPILESTPVDFDLLAMIKSEYFHLTIWPCTVMCSIAVSYANNVTSIAHALEFAHPVYTVYVLSITVVFGRLSFGLINDKFNSALCGFVLLLSGSVFSGLGFLMMVLGLNDVTLYLVTFLLGVGLSIGAGVPSYILAARFGKPAFPYIVNTMYCFNAIFTLGFQTLIGVLYDRYALPHGFCYGSQCFFVSSIVMLSFAILISCLHIINFCRQRNSRLNPGRE